MGFILITVSKIFMQNFKWVSYGNKRILCADIESPSMEVS